MLALTDLVGELATRSNDFRTWWGGHTVQIHSTGTNDIHHPVVGDMTIGYEVLSLASTPGISLVTYLAEPATPAADALNLLRSWIAEQPSTRPEIQVDLDDIIWLGSTGGTTGKPKGVMNTHRTVQTAMAHMLLNAPYSADEKPVNLAAAPIEQLSLVRLSASAASVRCSLRPLYSNSGWPTSSSSWRICRLTAGWVSDISSAARL